MSDKIIVTGGTGLIGTNLVERLRADGNEAIALSSKDDLRDPAAASRVFKEHRPGAVFHLAARVGGIYANANNKAGFYSDNVLINTNVVNACVETGISYLFAMGTGCAYPKRLEGQLLREEDFLDGLPEPTNDAYAYAKRGLLVHLHALKEGGVMDYCFCIPANIYGPHDNFHPTHSHVVPGLVRRFCEAADQEKPEVAVWGDGSACRDFLHIDDCVDAMILLTQNRFCGPVNVTTGKQTTIKELAEEIKRASGFAGNIAWDTSYPSGQSGRRFDTSKMEGLGWKPKVSLAEGLDRTVQWFRDNRSRISER